MNPAAAVRGPKHVVTKGATPVLSPAEARKLLAAIDTGTLAGLRDRALLSVMLYSFARVSARRPRRLLVGGTRLGRNLAHLVNTVPGRGRPHPPACGAPLVECAGRTGAYPCLCQKSQLSVAAAAVFVTLIVAEIT